MVYIDWERKKLENAVSNAEEKVAEAEWNLWCYDNRGMLQKNHLKPGKAYAFGTLDRVLVSDAGLEKCVFDNGGLKIISPIIGGSNIPDTAVYECSKCKKRYMSPLNERDQEAHNKRMREMVFN